MGLKSIDVKAVYRTGDSDLLNEFYIPCLSKAKRYDRAVGYFSSDILVYAMSGVSEIVKNNGEIRLIIGYPLDNDEFEQVEKGNELQHLNHSYRKKLEEIISIASSSKHMSYRLELFFLLVVNNILKIKFAYRRQGMYHEKIGIITDAIGDKLIFTGSANETVYGLTGDFNYESVTVYKSWEESNYENYGIPFEVGFEKLWRGEDGSTVVVDIPSSLYKEIKQKNETLNLSLEQILVINETDILTKDKQSDNKNYPRVPTHINGKIFSVFDHQSLALNSWLSQGYKGILRLATGSGKTITSLYAVSKIFEFNPKNKLFLIVAVPYISLAEQWVKEMALFNMKPIECFGSRDRWEDSLRSAIANFTLETSRFFCVVTVNATLRGDVFQEQLSRIRNEFIFFIGDECHHHSTDKFKELIPETAFKVGLSATPFDDDEDIEFLSEIVKKENLKSIYGDVAYTYSLKDGRFLKLSATRLMNRRLAIITQRLLF